MQNRCDSILRNVNRDIEQKPLNILTFACHESFQNNWAIMPHTFYLFGGKNRKQWSETYRPLPKNHILLSGENAQIRPDMKLDLIISMNKAEDFQVCQQISQSLGIPIIVINHTLPYYLWNQKQINQISSLKGKINVFISRYSVEKWGYSLDDPTVKVVNHAINTDIFKPNPDIPKDGKVQSVVNLWKDRDWCTGYNLGQRLLKDLPHRHFGSSDDRSTKPAKDLGELIKGYQSCSAFLNTSSISPIPTSLLEAASCSCTLVSTYNCAIPEIFKNEIHGFFSEDESYLRSKLEYSLNNPEKVQHLGENARKLILEKFNLEQHINEFNEIFKKSIL